MKKKVGQVVLFGDVIQVSFQDMALFFFSNGLIIKIVVPCKIWKVFTGLSE